MKQYLEDGRKIGRDLQRDEMDERVILAGDLELTNLIIQSIDVAPDVDRYLSVTMSFKEDEVSREILEAITEDFRKFVGVAYLPEEFNFYAEAHLPKIKSYLDESGKLVERKPHIHIVIPKLNLISGGHLEALGYYKSNIQFIEAFQEHVNAKYGLASPKDHRRAGLTDASEMISRYKGDLFKPASRILKEAVLNAMLDRRIESYDEFMALLAEHGETRLRNQGGENEYANVKPHDASKGVNLKEHVFSRAFVALPTHEKLVELSADVAPAYHAVGEPREAETRYLAALTQWEQTRAFEVKYLNNGNTKSFPAYQAASLDERVAMLAERADVFYSKHLEDHHESGSERPSGQQSGSQSSSNSRGTTSGRKRGFGGIDTDDRRLRSDGRLHEFDWRVGVGTRTDARVDSRFPRGAGPGNAGGLPADTWRDISGGPRGATPERRQHGALPDSQGAPSPAINRMRGMSGVPVDRFAPRRAVLVPDHALHQLEHERAISPHRLRRDSDRDRAGVKATGRRADSVLSQRMRDEQDRLAQRRAGDEFSVIRARLDPRRLLAELSHSHGVRPEKYGITTGRDGASRIRAGGRNLNVSDFLTKELHLPWADASEILRGSYQRQVLGAARPLAKELPRAELWREYTSERDASRNARQDAMAAQQTGERSRRAEIRRAFDAARDAAGSNLTLRPSGRRALVSIARMTKADAEQSLRAQIKIERDLLKAKHGPRHGTSFGDFLHARAQAGDARALLELRRMRPTQPDAPQPEENWIMPAQADRERRNPRTNARGADTEWNRDYDNQVIYRAPQLTYEVHRDGDVTYRHDGRSVVRDHGSAVRVLQADPAAIETALRLALAKFGSVLELRGPVEKQREAAKIAADAGLYVEFSDESLNDIMQTRRVELVAARAATTEETRSLDSAHLLNKPAAQESPRTPTPTQEIASDPGGGQLLLGPPAP